jgi:hypothetical protein
MYRMGLQTGNIMSALLFAATIMVIPLQTSPSGFRASIQIRPSKFQMTTWPSLLCLRGGGAEEGGDVGRWGGRELEEADSGLDDEFDYGTDQNEPPWPTHENKEEEMDMIKGIKEPMRLGEDK